jgi:hypothetical protein
MPTEELKEFVEERLEAYDPDIDLSEGSPAQTQVVDPIVLRYTPDPFEMDVDAFIDARLQQEFPDTNFREGSGIRDLLVKANQLLMDPISREVKLIKQGQSLANPDLLSSSEADSLVANLFVSRDTGGLSTGTVRLYFNAPVALNLSVGNVCYTADGLRFLPTTLQSISAEAMLFNQSGSLYYFDIQVTAEAAGTDYNVEKQEIVGITNLNTAVKVENLQKFEGGITEETTDELVDKAETSVTERSLVVARGVAARLDDQFDSLSHLQVVGMFDDDMNRDVLEGGDMGPVLLSNTDGFTEDDEDGDAYTYAFKARYADFVSDLFGATGDLEEEEYYLTVSQVIWGTGGEVPVGNLDHIILAGADFTDADVGRMLVTIDGLSANVGVSEILAVVDPERVKIDRAGVVDTTIYWLVLRPPADFEIESVVGAQELKLKSPLPVDRAGLIWSIRKKELTISGIPGGILYSEDQAVIPISSGEIHIGGATDFYVRGTSVEEKELVLEAISDEAPLVASLTGETDSSSTPKKSFFRDDQTDFVTEGVLAGYSLVIETGVDAGTKTILRVGKDSTGADDPNYLQISPAITSTAADLRYKVVDDIDIDLREPRTMRGTGSDLQTIQLSQQVTTAGAIDFLGLGTEVEDTLRIITGEDEGDYEVTAISGTGNKNLDIDAQMDSTATNLAWELFKLHDGLDFPLVRVSAVELLDSSQQPTGDKIPYAVPVDSRSTSFSNAGRGTKLSTTDAVTGIVGSVDMRSPGEGGSFSYPMDNTGGGKVILSVSVNGGADIDIDLGGAVSRTDVLNKINTAIFNVGGNVLVDGEQRLTIRSGDRWLRVMPESGSNSQNLTDVGFVITGEDNRQIRSLSTITDWTSAFYDLKTEKDVAYIRTGYNIGHFYVVAVEVGRLIVLGVDEETGRARFLQPDTSISVVAGSRSYGKARVYFLDPTSFEVHGAWRPALKSTTTFAENKAISLTGEDISEDEAPRTYFTATINGSEMRFIPDPDLKRAVLPASGEDVPNNLSTNGVAAVESDDAPTGALGQNSRDADLDFLLREVRVGDWLQVTYQPVQGDNDIRKVSDSGTITYPTDMQGKTLIISLDGAPPKTLTFSDQLEDQDDVVEEINDFFGETIAFIETISSAKYLRLEADFPFTVHKNSTAIYQTSPAKALLWTAAFSANEDNKAAADIDGYYVVTYVGDDGTWSAADPTDTAVLVLDQATAGGASKQSQHFEIYRPGNQRLHSTGMNTNIENGLYYMDVELVSEGIGDEWNLDAGEVFEIEGFYSDGYRLVVGDENLTFSMQEQVVMSLSHRILAVGQSDKPSNATPLSSQNIQVEYDRSPLAASVQSFASSDLERVLNASILVRHLQPHYLNFEYNYREGSSSDVVEEDILDHLEALGPDDRVEVSDLINISRARSATYVQTPIELVAVIHDQERKITVDRSEDYVTKGRLATFFPDNIVVERETVTAL